MTDGTRSTGQVETDISLPEILLPLDPEMTKSRISGHQKHSI